MMSKLFHFFQFHNHLDNEGRPLSEDFTGVQTHAKVSFTKCPYPGKRYGKLMNTAALMQFSHNKTLANLYLRFALQLTSTSSEGRLLELWQTALSAKWLVHYLILTKTDYVPDGALAAVYKLSRGIYDLVVHMIFAEKDPLKKYAISEYIEFLDDRDLLIGRSDVCAAPEALIKSTLQTILQPGDVFNFEKEPFCYYQIDKERYKGYIDTMFRLELICGLMAVNKSECKTSMPLKIHNNHFESIEQAALYYGHVTPFGNYLQTKNKIFSKLLKLGIQRQNLDLLNKSYTRL